MADFYKINPLVLIGVPTLQRIGPRWEWMDAYASLQIPLGAAHARLRVYGEYVADARNQIATRALETNCDWLLFISDDVIAPPNIFELLYRHKKKLVTGVYWTKSYPHQPYIWKDLMKGPHLDWKYGEFFKIDWAGCFTAGEMVMTPSGFKAIETLTPGDMVISGNGIERKVLKTYSRKYEGIGFKISSYGNGIGMPVTEKHRFKVVGRSTTDKGTWRPWSRRIEKDEWKTANEIKPGDILAFPIPQRVDEIKEIDLLEFINTKEVSPRHEIETAIAKWGKEDSGYGQNAFIRKLGKDFDVPKTTADGWVRGGSRPYGIFSDEKKIQFHSARPSMPINRRIPVNSKLMRFIGLFLGDGCLNKRHGVSFTFSPQERQLAEEVFEIGYELFGIKASIRPPIQNANYILVKFQNRSLYLAMKGILEDNTNTYTKCVPSWCMFLSPKLQRQMIDGYLDADGYTSGKKEKAESVNLKLLLGIKYLYARNGIAASIAKREPRMATRQDGSVIQNKGTYSLQACPTGKLHRGHFIADGICYSVVKNVEKTWINADVYNLEVDVDHSYLTTSGTSKNCDALLIHTDVLKAIPYPWFSHDWTFTETQGHVPLATEDLYFYTKAKQAGFDLWCDSACQCLHQDRDTGKAYGLMEDMPQFTGLLETVPPEKEKKYVADIGCGFLTPYFGDANVKRFDINPEVKPDIQCDVRAIPEMDETFDIVRSCHVLEHFFFYEAHNLIKEWLRILKVGGELRIYVPNLAYAAREVLKTVENPEYDATYAFGIIYGTRPDIKAPEHDHNQVHRMGFTPEGLKRLLSLFDCLDNIEVTEGYEGSKDGTATIYARATKVRSSKPFRILNAWNEVAARKNSGGDAVVAADLPGNGKPPLVLEESLEL